MERAPKPKARLRFLQLALLLFVLNLTFAAATTAKPRLLSIEPYVWQRGEEVDVIFRVENLGDVQQLLDYQQELGASGIEVIEWIETKPKFVKAKIRVSADCDLGRHPIRLCTNTGITDLRLAYVTQHARIPEVEPNDSREQAMTVASHSTVTGRLLGNHDDWIAIEAKQDERVSLELFGIRLGRTLVDAKLEVHTAAGEMLADSDDTLLTKHDPFVSFVAPADGLYYARIASSAGDNNANYFYALQVGSFPRPIRVMPNGGQAGEALDIVWHNADGSSQTETIQLPSRDALPTHDPNVIRVFPGSADDQTPSSVPIFVSSVPCFEEAEPNNTYPQATRLEVPGSIRAKMNEKRDRDCFVFTAKKGMKLVAKIHARRELRTNLDSDLSLRHGDGKFITSNDDQPNGIDSVIPFEVPADGDYLLIVRDQLHRGGAGFDYWLEVKPAESKIVLNLPERDRNRAITLAVPRGARMALRVTATKENVDGVLKLGLEDLPAGLTAETSELRTGDRSAAVIVSATEDAELLGGLARLFGSIEIGAEEGGKQVVTGQTVTGQVVTGELYQKQLLVGGRNNIYTYGHEDSRLAVAIVDAAPFDIELVQPTVPLVRNGSADLKSLQLVPRDLKRRSKFAYSTIRPASRPEAPSRFPRTRM